MAPAQRFEDLLVWQKAHRFVINTSRLTSAFPKHELYALGSQLRRAAYSVPANVAEGFRRRTTRDKARFITIAQGSAEEAPYCLMLAQELGYGCIDGLREDIDEVARMLPACERSLHKGVMLTTDD